MTSWLVLNIAHEWLAFEAPGATMFTKVLHRPAMAIVISIILLFLGVLGIKTLPIAQFPDIAPPTVMVSISYPGASANVLVESVLIPLEQSINGVQNMRFITSSATSAGEAAIIIYFEPGTDPKHQCRERAKPGQHRAVPAPAPGACGRGSWSARSCRAC